MFFASPDRLLSRRSSEKTKNPKAFRRPWGSDSSNSKDFQPDASEPYGRPAAGSPNNNRLSKFASAINPLLQKSPQTDKSDIKIQDAREKVKPRGNPNLLEASH